MDQITTALILDSVEDAFVNLLTHWGGMGLLFLQLEPLNDQQSGVMVVSEEHGGSIGFYEHEVTRPPVVQIGRESGRPATHCHASISMNQKMVLNQPSESEPTLCRTVSIFDQSRQLRSSQLELEQLQVSTGWFFGEKSRSPRNQCSTESRVTRFVG
jgi:hypothetical protein